MPAVLCSLGSPRRAYSQPASQRLSVALQQAQAYRQRTALPFMPLAVTFTDVSYSVPMPPVSDGRKLVMPIGQQALVATTYASRGGKVGHLEGNGGKLILQLLHLMQDAGAAAADPSAAAGQLQLLKGINGAFRPNILTALMGASGAGKTTLMDVLAGRKTGGTISGDIRVGGFPKEQHTFARVMG